jgi:hypothetical protein
MKTDVLTREFEQGEIKRRKGSYGTMIDYIEHPTVIRRLNEAFDFDWSFKVTQHVVTENEVIVLGELSAEGITKMQFGSKRIARNSKTGENISLGDDLKSAASDCLKKCATLFGVGLHLYGGDDEKETKEPARNKSTDRITKEQLSKIKELRTKLGWKPEDLINRVKELFSTEDVLSLNPTMAQTLIKHLTREIEAQQEEDEIPF